MKNTPEISNPEELAIAAISFLASDFDQLTRFLSLTGLDPSNLREIASDREFLIAVLEYIMSDEALLISFSENARINPFNVAKARDQMTDQLSK